MCERGAVEWTRRSKKMAVECSVRSCERIEVGGAGDRLGRGEEP